MQYIINIPPEIVDLINLQITKGDYRTVQDFIITAVQNQVYLIEHADAISVNKIQRDENQIESKEFPDVKKHEIITQEFDMAKGHSLLSGFWNKFFPVKVTIRTLSNLMATHDGPIVLETLQETASLEARKIGLKLVKTEKSSGRKRGDRLFTGLPVNRSSEKSRLRFKSHFVGNLTRTHINGMPGTLRMINMTRGSDGITYVALTKHGEDFSNLVNPILDQKDYSKLLSEEEQKYLVELIQTELPKETEKIRETLEFIEQGKNDTKSLLGTFSSSEEMVTPKRATELSGMLNRITDLGLVIRRYDGLSYIYEVLQKGKEITQN